MPLTDVSFIIIPLYDYKKTHIKYMLNIYYSVYCNENDITLNNTGNIQFSSITDE